MGDVPDFYEDEEFLKRLGIAGYRLRPLPALSEEEARIENYGMRMMLDQIMRDMKTSTKH
jgi:hypothetical protein